MRLLLSCCWTQTQTQASAGVALHTSHQRTPQTETHSRKSNPVYQDRAWPLLLLIGDCLTNARASLDILFFGIIEKYFDPPFDISNRNDRRITAFPIWSADGEQGYRNRLVSLANRKVPTAVITDVESVQPNIAGNEPLGWLNTLVNTDKHRMVLLTVGVVGAARITMWKPPNGVRSMVQGASIRNGATFKTHPAMLAAINDGSMQVDVQATIGIAWKDVAMPNEPVEITLDGIIKFSAAIVEKMGRFIQPL